MNFPSQTAGKRSRAEWIGILPSHWDEVRLKHGLRLITEKASEDTFKVALENIESWSGRYIETETVFEGDGTAFQRGDLLFGKLRPYLAKALLVDAPGQAVGDFHVLRPTAEVHGRFALYYVLSRDFIAVVDGSTYGAKMPRASWDFMANLPLPLPPPSEQAAIVTFLDRETGKIDALVEEQRRLIGLLKEKRQAVISHAVTKGLDTNARMKPSGIEWLGDVPEHWVVTPIRSVARLESGHTPSRSRPEWWVDCTVPWFSLADIWQVRKEGRTIITETSEQVSEIGLANSSARVLPAGTVMLSRTASVGFAAIMGVDMATTQDFANWVCGPKLHNHFLLWTLRAMRPEFSRLMMGSTHNTIYMPDLAALRMPLPPMDEQLEVAAFLQSATGKIDRLLDQATAATALLSERRAALISAAVTGKIDVRGAASAPGRIRLLVAAEIVDLLSHKKSFGRVKLQKLLYLAEAHGGIGELQGKYLREAAGPLDRALIAEVDAGLQQDQYVKVIQSDGPGSQVFYHLRGERGVYHDEFVVSIGDKAATLRALVEKLGDLDTKSTEAVTTLYAVWNDALLDHREPTDAMIVSGVLEDWHPEKARKFKAEELHTWLGWMRRNKLVPHGNGPRTITGRLFV